MRIYLAPPRLEDLLEALEHFRHKPPATGATGRYLDFHAEILRAHYRHASAFADSIAREKLGKHEVEKKVRSGIALAAGGSLEIGGKNAGRLMGELCTVFATFRILESDLAGQLIAMEAEGKIDAAALVRNIIDQDARYFVQVSAETSVKTSTLAFLAEHLARPVLAGASCKFDDVVELPGFMTNKCPMCLNEPLMAMLDTENADGKDGQRILKCSLCHTRWEFMRLECPFCRNTNQKEIKFLFFDEGDPYRVYVCERCRRYIKTVDRRKCAGRNPELLVESLVTPNLDEAALKKGYLRGSMEAWGSS